MDGDSNSDSRRTTASHVDLNSYDNQDTSFPIKMRHLPSPASSVYPTSSSLQESSTSQLLPTSSPSIKTSPSLKKDTGNLILLVCLYLLQGVPIGLTFGSIPFLLKSKLSYSELALFSLASYPYSLKLLWSPIVDSLYFSSIGRRKSWIIPMQLFIGGSLFWLGHFIDDLMNQDILPVSFLASIFFGLVFLCATQDIAVDGWALTLLKKENIEYASTAQTIGLNTGYFLSFTVFLALNSKEFCNKYLFSDSTSSTGLITLGSYLKFWGLVFLILTTWLIFFKKEETIILDKENESVISVYRTMFSVLKTPQMKSLVLVLLLSKLGFIANEAVTGLKLLEKGLQKEDLALAVLLDFPFQILGGYWAARWSSGPRPLQPVK